MTLVDNSGQRGHLKSDTALRCAQNDATRVMNAEKEKSATQHRSMLNGVLECLAVQHLAYGFHMRCGALYA